MRRLHPLIYANPAKNQPSQGGGSKHRPIPDGGFWACFRKVFMVGVSSKKAIPRKVLTDGVWIARKWPSLGRSSRMVLGIGILSTKTAGAVMEFCTTNINIFSSDTTSSSCECANSVAI